MKFKKMQKNLVDSDISEMDSMTAAQLNKVAADASSNIAVATKERDDNKNYQSAKSIKGDFDSALRDAKDRQNAKIAYVLLRRKELAGEELDEETLQELRNMRDGVAARQPKGDCAKSTFVDRVQSNLTKSGLEVTVDLKPGTTLRSIANGK